MATTAPSIPRVRLATTPTPLQRLDRLSRELGVELWVKRDDLTGLLESGNKIRKLEFLLGEARGAGADTLITCGTVQSNCCRAVAAISARLGLRAVLVLKGSPPAEPDGNFLLARLLGAHVRFCDDAAWERVDERMAEVAEDERAAGRRPFVIPESGATVAGALGYLACAEELAAQVAGGTPEFDSVVLTAFSGGSQAGLLMGAQLAGLGSEIVSVPVAWQGERVRAYVADVIARARERYGLPVEVPHTVRVLDGYQGVGRAAVEARELQTVATVARTEGLVLDPVYTAKAFGAVLDVLRREPGRLGRRVCFVHTGGVFSLFPFRRDLAPLLDGAGGW